MSRAVLDHSDRSSVTAVEDNTVLLAQYLAAQQQQQQSRYSGAGNASIHEELALLRAQQQLQQQQQQQQPSTQEEYHLAATRRALALNSLGYGAPGAMGSLHQSPQLGSLGNAEVSQLELLLAQARFKAAMGSGGAGASPSQPGLILPTLANGNGNHHMGASPYFGGASAGDTSALLHSANSRAALIHNILGLSSLGDGGDSAQQDALRRALLQSSLAGRRHL